MEKFKKINMAESQAVYAYYENPQPYTSGKTTGLKYTCKECVKMNKTVNNTINFSGGSVSHGEEHLWEEHKIEVREGYGDNRTRLKNKRKSDGDDSTGFENALQMRKKKPLYDTALALWVINHKRPFSIVEDDGLKLLFGMLQPVWRPICGKTISNKMLPNLYNAALNAIKKVSYVYFITK